MLYSVSMGVLLSLHITKKILLVGPKTQEEKHEENVFNMIIRIFRSWIGIVIPLLLMGALVETFLAGALFAVKGGGPSF